MLHLRAAALRLSRRSALWRHYERFFSLDGDPPTPAPGQDHAADERIPFDQGWPSRG